MKQNAYDFDKTIYKDDSNMDFYFFCLKKQPGILLELPVVLAYALLYLLRLCSKTTFKEIFFRFLRHLNSVDDLVVEFWDSHQNKIAPFYLSVHKPDDIIISASPEFLLQPICERLNIRHLIASRVNKQTGQYDGENCWGEEKARRFKSEMPDININEFYSDSLSDAPMARIAETAYLVYKDKITLWSDEVS